MNRKDNAMKIAMFHPSMNLIHVPATYARKFEETA
jgi:hypothetical protein